METITQTSKVLYTAKTHTIGGRDHGMAKSLDGHLEIKLSAPGTSGIGTNPEQLFAAGWSACFEGAIGIAAAKARITLPEESTRKLTFASIKEFFLEARLNVSLPELDREIAYHLIYAGENICPYSKAIKGNIKTQINLV